MDFWKHSLTIRFMTIKFHPPVAMPMTWPRAKLCWSKHSTVCVCMCLQQIDLQFQFAKLPRIVFHMTSSEILIRLTIFTLHLQSMKYPIMQAKNHGLFIRLSDRNGLSTRTPAKAIVVRVTRAMNVVSWNCLVTTANYREGIVSQENWIRCPTWWPASSSITTVCNPGSNPGCASSSKLMVCKFPRFLDPDIAWNILRTLILLIALQCICIRGVQLLKQSCSMNSSAVNYEWMNDLYIYTYSKLLNKINLNQISIIVIVLNPTRP